MATAVKTIENSDVNVLMVMPEDTIHQQDLHGVDIIKSCAAPAILAINKIDTVPRQDLLPVIDRYSKIHPFAQIIPISALEGTGVDELVGALAELLPEGPALFPEDDLSDLPVRFFVAEIIREQIIRMTGEEIPYKTAVVVETFQEECHRVLIRADIHSEKESQKKILIGKGGSMIKKIGTAAREKIELFIARPVRLELFVKVTPRWSQSIPHLRDFGYSPL
jgi:GTP-binding protein Era